jgi:hypothetical protein
LGDVFGYLSLHRIGLHGMALGEKGQETRAGEQATRLLQPDACAMTEEEAKLKTCHKTLVPLLNEAGATSACIGSQCMAWRYLEQLMYRTNRPEPGEEGWVGSYADAWTGAPYWVKPRPERHGYCGLVGKP